MIVKYARERGFKGNKKDPSLALGRKYFILGIDLHFDNDENTICVRRDSDGYPVLFELKFFDIVDTRIPEGWSLRPLAFGSLRLEPVEFGDDFWDRYHDGDSKAEALFEEVAKKIEAFHSER